MTLPKGNEGIQCDKCDFNSEDMATFNEHMKSHPLNCCTCSFKKDLDKHKEDEYMEVYKEDSNVDQQLLESCRVLEEKVMIERRVNAKNVEIIENMKKGILELEKQVEKANKQTMDIREVLDKTDKELKTSKDMINSELIKNAKKQEEIECDE